MNHIRLGLFTVPTVISVAQARGIFHDYDIELEVEQVASSSGQFRDFDSGRFDLLQTAFDNVANYRLNSSHVLGRPLDVSAVFALDWGMNLTLMSAPEVTSVTQLRGRVLTVDSESSGFAYVLYAILDHAGLSRADYEVISHGGAGTRLQKLANGESDATLLCGGLEVLGAARGLRALATSANVVEPYLGGVIAVNASWARANHDVLRRFRLAYERGRNIVLSTSEQSRVIAEIQADRGISADVSSALLRNELGDLGLARTSAIPRQAALNTLRLRARYSGFDTQYNLDQLLAPSDQGLILDV